MLDIGLLLVSLAVILLGAALFTNGVEWLGRLLGLSEGAVGSVLAAVGTALPETMIPIIAILLSQDGSNQIGIGAILGAPFMLGTLALGIAGIAALVFKKKRLLHPQMNVNLKVVGRDLTFFLAVYTIAIGATFIPAGAGRIGVAAALVIAYGIYLYIVFKDKGVMGEHNHLHPLYMARSKAVPPLGLVLVQLLLALGLIIGGAAIFVETIQELALMLGVPVFILALIIAPIATELPEKFNSIIWIRAGKDTLALGNITGAMVFQSSLIPAIGIVFTDWNLTKDALVTSFLVLLCIGYITWRLKKQQYLTPQLLLTGLIFYSVFALMIISGVIG